MGKEGLTHFTTMPKADVTLTRKSVYINNEIRILLDDNKIL